jgi:hypothetical protein
VPRLPSLAASAVIASVTLAAALGLAGPAAAKGGTKPVATSPAPAPPAPEPLPLDCFGDFGDPTIPNMTAPDVAVNYAATAGCVGVQSVGSTLRLAWVVLAPGWTYVVKSNGTGTNSRVQLLFTNTASGAQVDFRYEFGKVVIG